MNVNKELARLRKMSITELRARFSEVWNEPSRSGNRDFLMKRIIWRMQALEEGDLPERARNKALAMANDADLRVRAPAPGNGNTSELTGSSTTAIHNTLGRHDPTLPAPGTLLTRQWRGQTVLTKVLPGGGFEYEGDTYRSLSAVAKAVTGSHWNGRLFFGLAKSRNAKESRK